MFYVIFFEREMNIETLWLPSSCAVDLDACAAVDAGRWADLCCPVRTASDDRAVLELCRVIASAGERRTRTMKFVRCGSHSFRLDEEEHQGRFEG